MGLRINQNIAAQNAYRNLSVTDNNLSKSLEKLSSGFRINRAADDAAGLSISEGLRSQTSGLKVAVRNTQNGISVVQTAEGALNESTAILQRMRDLAVQTANAGSMDADARDAANKEFQQLNQELDRIGKTSSFGRSKLLDGSFGATATTATGRALAAGTHAGTIAAAIALVGGGTFKLTRIGGAPTAPAAGIDVTLPAKAVSATSSGQDIASAVNTAISTALKGVGYQLSTPIAINIASGSFSSAVTGQDVTDVINLAIKTELQANGYQGDEIQMTASTAANGDTTFTTSGASAFTMTDGTAEHPDRHQYRKRQLFERCHRPGCHRCHQPRDQDQTPGQRLPGRRNPDDGQHRGQRRHHLHHVRHRRLHRHSAHGYRHTR
ncbi:hypothetical protein [Actinoplanes subtropicus]|uniref:flagellin N-terminal helical domain-containing protein n=1 Tax=Actinoplanes subtropicus TaxID=543632 RepID=UPI00069221AF|nr:hypothetical protein [Actinoplanes subtropicus]